MQHKVLEEMELEVCDNGEIYSIADGERKLLKQYNAGKCKRGYYKAVVLYQGGKQRRYYVHRLIAAAFIPNPLNKPYVNHIDGNPINNNVNNLEWVTNSENLAHAYQNLAESYDCCFCGKPTHSIKGVCHACNSKMRWKQLSIKNKLQKTESLKRSALSIDFSKLNKRQKEFLSLRLSGHTQSDIARRYGITRQAVSAEFQNIWKQKG